MDDEQQQKAAPTERELEIRAAHNQELARIEKEHERLMAAHDMQAMGRMPLTLRLIFDDRLRARIERAATDMSSAAGFTPPHLIGKTEACMVVITRAIGWNLDPYAVAQSTYQTPDGKVGFEGKLTRAIAEASGLLRGAIKAEWYGEWDRLPRPSFKMVKRQKQGRNGTYEVTVPEPAWEYWGPIEHGLGVKITAVLAETGEEMSLSFDLVDAYPRNATTWPTRPKLQILNPAIRAFVNNVRSSLLMGVHFRDEPSEAPDMRDITPESGGRPADPMDRVVLRHQARVEATDVPQGQQDAPQASAQGQAETRQDQETGGASRPRRTDQERTEQLVEALGKATSAGRLDELMREMRGRLAATPRWRDMITAAEAEARKRVQAAASGGVGGDPVAVVLGKPAASWQEVARLCDAAIEEAEGEDGMADEPYQELEDRIRALSAHMPKEAAVLKERLEALPNTTPEGEADGDEDAQEGSETEQEPQSSGAAPSAPVAHRAAAPAQAAGRDTFVLRDAVGDNRGTYQADEFLERLIQFLVDCEGDARKIATLKTRNKDEADAVARFQSGDSAVARLLVQLRKAWGA